MTARQVRKRLAQTHRTRHYLRAQERRCANLACERIFAVASERSRKRYCTSGCAEQEKRARLRRVW